MLLQAVDVVGPHRWRWLLVDDRSGAALADHPVKWEPVVTAVVAAATSGHIPAELAHALDERGATVGWAALVAALRRVLAGDRDREQLLAGLGDVDTAILAAVVDRLPDHLEQDT